MRFLVIPDCHLKPWMFEDATAIMNSGKADNAVCLMDIPDDFGKDDPDLYKKAYDAAIRFAERFPQSLWCYGNHDLSYVWNKPETGFNPAVRMLVREKLEELERTLSSPSQLAYIFRKQSLCERKLCCTASRNSVFADCQYGYACIF